MAGRLLAEVGAPAAILNASAARIACIYDHNLADAIEVVRDVLTLCLRRSALDQPILSTTQALLDYLFVTMAYERAEQLRVIYLDARRRLLADEVMFSGTISEVALHPREILRRALEIGAAGLIVVHNHPSGDPTPSREDLLRTRVLVDAARSMDVVIHDHLIIARSGEASLRALGYL